LVKSSIRILGVTFGIIVAAYYLWNLTDIVFPIHFRNGKMPFMEMIALSSEARETFKTCRVDKQSSEVCNSVLKNELQKLSSSQREFFVIGDGVIICIDYTNRIFVLLALSFVEGRVIWNCSGAPSEALTKRCSPIH
jgi:hypothetical protein